MGLTHREFFRILPAALEGRPFSVSGSVVGIEEESSRITITLDPQQERQIALLRIPFTRVTFDFSGYSEDEIDAFMGRFERHYQRGGG
jgi:hypothetical protein